MGNMGPLPAGNPSMSHRGSSRFPRPRWRPLAPHPQPHTPYKAPIPGRKLKRRGAAVIDANPYRTSLKALQRGTNVPIRLIGGEVRGHGASKRSRQEKREQVEAEAEVLALVKVRARRLVEVLAEAVEAEVKRKLSAGIIQMILNHLMRMIVI